MRFVNFSYAKLVAGYQRIAGLPAVGSGCIEVYGKETTTRRPNPLARRLHRALIFAATTLGVFAFSGSPAFAAAPVVAGEESSAYVSSSGASLQARVDPEGSSTTYSFEYGTNSASGKLTPVGDAGSGTGTIAVESQLQGLSAGTLYHYRVLASNTLGETAAGPDETFTTQPEGSEFVLPDERQWELVSPPNHEGSIEAIADEYGVIQASENGDAITYASENPLVGEPHGNRALEPSQNLARRGTEGWSSEDITTPNNDVGVFTLGHDTEYKLFSPDLSLGFVEPRGETPLAPPVLPGETQGATIYLRNNSQCAPTPTESIPGTCYLALATKANTMPGSQISEPEGKGGRHPEFEGASPDLSHIVFEDTEPLLEGAGGEDLYEWAGGKLALVSVLPGNTGSAPGYLGLGKYWVVRHAVSNNGSRVIWHDGGQLYLRDMSKRETVEVDAPEPGGEGGSDADFQTASSDGSKIFFTDTARLTANSSASVGESAADLYVYEVTSGEGEPLAGRLTNLSADPNFTGDGERAAVQGEVLGASENGGYVYFVANGILGNAAEHGIGAEGNCRGVKPGRTCYLYVEHNDGSGWEAPKFIATLSSEDFSDWNPELSYLTSLTSRVSPNGQWLAFMSDQRLTGYDNTDLNSGEADEEVYLFNAKSDKLVCASCNPTGERPTGVYDPSGEEATVPRRPALLVDGRRTWEGRWLAGSVPGWTTDELDAAPYQSRYLSNNGRLFFDSADGLVPADVNGKEDVYELEPAGVGGCTPTVADASWVYVPSENGCVGLISSGTSSQETAFLDASTIGGRDSEGAEGAGDVFFLTTSQLTSADEGSTYQIYTAHECNTGSPCTSQAAPAVSPACNNEASCKPAPETQPSIYGAPSSGTSLSGLGNFAPASVPSQAPATIKPKPKTVKCKKTQKLNHGKCISKKKPKAKKTNRRAGR
jgi:hypothetical protein